MSDAADRLAQAIRDMINEAVQAAVKQERPSPPPARVAERPKVAEEDFDQCPWCNNRHMRQLMPVKEARHQLGGISPTTFYVLVERRTVAREDRPPLVHPGGRTRRIHEKASRRFRLNRGVAGEPASRKTVSR